MLLPALRHELSFWHGGSRLVGDLVLPSAPGPHPLVLVVGEPETTERDHSSWLDGMAEAGFACFTWGRAHRSDYACRGGASRNAARQVADQARETLAALDRVSCLPQLDPSAVAVVGWGEGGWAAAQAATFSNRIGALVLASTPTAAPEALVEHRAVQRLREAGLAGAEITAARDAVRGRIEAGVEALPDDPRPTLSAVTVPVLALFGEQDPTLPLEESVRSVRAAARDAGHDDVQVAVVRGADRLLRVRPAHGLGYQLDGRHQFGEWPPGLTAVIADWLDARICLPDDLPAFVPPSLPGPTSAAGGGPGWARRLPGVAAPSQALPLLPVRQVRRRIRL